MDAIDIVTFVVANIGAVTGIVALVLQAVLFHHSGPRIGADLECVPDGDLVLADKVGAKYGADLRLMDNPGEARLAVTLRLVRVNYTG